MVFSYLASVLYEGVSAELSIGDSPVDFLAVSDGLNIEVDLLEDVGLWAARPESTPSCLIFPYINSRSKMSRCKFLQYKHIYAPTTRTFCPTMLRLALGKQAGPMVLPKGILLARTNRATSFSVFFLALYCSWVII